MTFILPRTEGSVWVVYKHVMAFTLQWIVRCIKLHFDNLQGRFNDLQDQHDGFTGQCNSLELIAVVYRAIVMACITMQ